MAHPGQSIMVSPIPGASHTIRHHTALGGNYGTTLNKFSYWLANIVKAKVLSKAAKGYREDYQGINITTRSIKKAMLSAEKTFYAISPSLFPKPGYWPSCAHVVGYYERNKARHWEPDAALLQFLKHNEKIVLITFGSMSNPNPQRKNTDYP